MATIDTTTGQPTLVTPPVPTVLTVPPPTAQTVYSADNISQAATNPVKPVNPVLEDYNAYMNTPEMVAARAKVSQTQQALNAEKADLRSTTTGIKYQNEKALGSTGASLNAMGLQAGQASELSTNRQAALAETLQADTAFLQGMEKLATDQYNIISQEKDKIKTLIAQTGNKAGITVNDSFEVATEKAYQWHKKQEKKAKEEAKKAAKDAEKKDLKKMVAALGGSTKNKKGGSLSSKELEKEYERLTSAKTQKENARSDQEWNMKIAQFNKSMSGGGEDKSTSFYKTATALKSQGKDWGYIANELGKTYNLTPGSDYSAQLDSIMTGKAPSGGANLIEVGGKLIDKNTGDVYEID